MAIVNSWDGGTLPAITGTASAATVDQSIGKPAPAFRFDAGVVAYHAMSTPGSTSTPGSMRFRLRTPPSNPGTAQIIRFRNIIIGFNGANSIQVNFSGSGGGGPQSITVAASTWITVEINLTSGTAGRVRVWNDNGSSIYDRTSSMPLRAGGYFGSGVAGGSSGNYYHLDDITITDTAADIAPPPDPEPEPDPSLGMKAYLDGAWAEHPVKVYKDGAWLEVPVRWYGGPGWPLSTADRIQTATTLTEMQQALTDLGTVYGATVQIRQIGAVGIGYYEAASTIEDGYLRTAAKALATAISRYPTSLLKTGAGAADGWAFYLGRKLMLSGTEASGFYNAKGMFANSQLTARQMEVTADAFHGGVFVVHHEIAHGLWEQKTGAALTTFKNEMAAAQPPGHVWGTQDDSFAGEHPLGFARWYGRTDANEDQADIIGWILTPALWERDGSTWFVDDPYLAAKAAAARKWLLSLGFTGLQ